MDDMNDGVVPTPAATYKKDYESAVEVESDEEDEVYRDNKMEGLQILVVEASKKMADEASIEMADGGLEELPEVEALSVESLVREPVGVEIRNSNSNVLEEAINSREEQKEQLQDLIDSGYTLEEIEGWRKNLKVEGILVKGNHNLNKEIQNSVINYDRRFAVIRYSFNSQDLFLNYYWPYY